MMLMEVVIHYNIVDEQRRPRGPSKDVNEA